jgi:hypothetical protein
MGAFQMTTINLFKPDGKSHRYISEVSTFRIKDGLLSITYKTETNRITINTTLPFFIEESEPLDEKG